MTWVIRYRPDTDLGRRFRGVSQPWATREEAERVRMACANADVMETIEEGQR